MINLVDDDNDDNDDGRQTRNDIEKWRVFTIGRGDAWPWSLRKKFMLSSMINNLCKMRQIKKKKIKRIFVGLFSEPKNSTVLVNALLIREDKQAISFSF